MNQQRSADISLAVHTSQIFAKDDRPDTIRHLTVSLVCAIA